jgi:hypothetical protein
MMTPIGVALALIVLIAQSIFFAMLARVILFGMRGAQRGPVEESIGTFAMLSGVHAWWLLGSVLIMIALTFTAAPTSAYQLIGLLGFTMLLHSLAGSHVGFETGRYVVEVMRTRGGTHLLESRPHVIFGIALMWGLGISLVADLLVHGGSISRYGEKSEVLRVVIIGVIDGFVGYAATGALANRVGQRLVETWGIE